MVNINGPSRGWCFTLNNYTQEQEETIKKIECKYLVFGHEHTKPGEGTPHLQGYIFFKNKRCLNPLRKIFPHGTHLEAQQGATDQAANYCKKEGVDIFEKGERPLTKKEIDAKGNKGNQDKWEEMLKHAEDQDTTWIRENYPKEYTRYEATFERIKNRAREEKNLDLDNKGLRDHFLWLWGPTGSGKSHSARAIAAKIDPDHEPYLKDWNKWWNGYTGQKVTIIDEASPERLEHLIDFLKKWADKWTFTAEVKGSSYNAIRPEYIIITSNYNMKDCIPKMQDYAALKRRFSEIEKYDKEQAIDWPPPNANEVVEQDANEIVTEPPVPGVILETQAPKVVSKNNTQEEAVSVLLNLGEQVYDLEDPEDLERKRKRDEYLEQCKQANLKMRRID